MKSIIEKIKSIWPFKKQKTKPYAEYTDLAPVDNIENGAGYLNALNWALGNKRIKNIALAGPYGSGKSSIIETYLKKHPMIRKKSLRISMATFVELTSGENGDSKRIIMEQDEIEVGILKQLFYKVDYKKIPQSRYRKLHKISFWRIWGYLIGLSIIISLLIRIFTPETFDAIIDKIIAAGSSIALPMQFSFIDPSVVSLVLFGILALVILSIFASLYRSISSRFKVKEIKLPVDATIKSGEEANENIFDKYIDEIVYFFEETKYRVVFFEDLDRLEDSAVFVHLRELNTLLNNYTAIKKPIVFVYAVKDDIFSDADRTKFFEFIIPVIPIINSTNSGEILLDKLESSKSIGIQHNISQSYVLDVSPYISDMRILQNIYNEFIIYKKTLREEQDLKLLDEPMMALIIFKNLYPRDFSDIQMEKGIVKKAFSDKQKYSKSKQSLILSEIDESEKILEGIQLEALKNLKELKISLLCEITNWQGIANQFTFNGGRTIQASTILQDNFDLSTLDISNQCSGNCYRLNGNGSISFTCNRFTEIYSSYVMREKRIKIIEENRIADEQKKVEKLKLQRQDISGWSLKRLIEQFGFEEVLSDEVQKNKLLSFLLRKGYIDEKYVNYINYFKGNTVTKDDMNFILSVKNLEPQPFNYELTKTPMVIQRLQTHEFAQKEIYNFSILEYMLSNNDCAEKQTVFIRQLADEEAKSWAFIDEFVDSTKYQSKFIMSLAPVWLNMWGYIASNGVLTYERKLHYLSLLISCVDIETLCLMNENNEMSNFFEQNEDVLQQLASINSSKVIAIITELKIIFRKVLTENVPDDVLAYIFDNDSYELNSLMIRRIVEYKNKEFVPDLDLKNYTAIIKLGYAPLIRYVRENLVQYVETIVLTGESAFDEEEQILDLLRRSIDNQELCVKIIKHEEFLMDDIERCCKDQIETHKSAVNHLWNALFKYDKIIPKWENISRYWVAFKFSQDLLNYMETHVEELVGADSKCISDDFIRGFIGGEIDDKVFGILLPKLKMASFDIDLKSVTENRVSVMIDCRYFDFSADYFEIIKNSFPDLCAKYILENQAIYIDNIDQIPMDSNLLESLIFSSQIEGKTTQKLLDTYSDEHLTAKIAENLHDLKFTMDLAIFNYAWSHLNESGRRGLMLENLNLLDADALHSCFTDLEKWYSEFIDRSRQHIVELEDTPQNRELANRLQEVEYITSNQLKEREEYDPVAETEKVKTVIVCRVKAIKQEE